ncbi:tail protein [Acinetobacter phage Presley]|uniref:Tail protein n=1 Tax=Acinetobacter phage Presley TaxID=1406780 RepID=U5PZQ4_9CAUD|nr:tail protein [Acinetobacter phage Presley]AGY48127.1 tail protein [Acinetobacter phage Presley]
MSDLDQINQSLLDGDHARIWEAIEDANTMRTAGDEAVSNSVKAVENNTHVNASGLSQEVIDREAGDLRQQQLYELLNGNLTEFTIDFSTRITSLVAEHEIDITELRHRISMAETSFASIELNLNRKIDKEVVDRKAQYDEINERVKNYEHMLSDITMDSAQITMDNGEIQFGAWTILSQARQWDLEILRQFKNYKDQNQQTVDDALKDFQDRLPNEKDIIDKAIEQLSSAPVIQELDKLLAGNIEDIDQLQKDLLAQVKKQQEDAINLANNTAESIRVSQAEMVQRILTESTERIEAIQREARIRQAQLLQEAADRSAEIEEKLTDVWASIDEETQERLKQIDLLKDGLTQEIQHRIDGDTSITNAFDNYKASTDGTLANVQRSIEVVAAESASTANAVTVLDGRVNTLDTDTQQAITNSALALDKANIAIDANNVTADKVAAVEADMANAKLDINANAKALQDMSAELKTVGDEVTSMSGILTNVQTDLNNAENTIATHGQAIDGLKITSKQNTDEIATIASSITDIKADINTIQGDMTNKADAKALADLTIQVIQNSDGINSLGGRVNTLENSVVQIGKDIANKADASYVETIDNKVTVLKDSVDSNTADIVTIRNSVTQAEKDIAKKADTTYVDTINNQVTINKEAIKAQQDKLVSLDASINQATNAILINGGSDLTNDLTRNYNTPGYLGKTESTTASNTNYIVMGNNSGTDNIWVHSSRFLLFDPKRMYRLRVRFCVYETTAGTASFYFGVAAKNADKTAYVNSDGVLVPDGPASSFYMIYALQPPVGQWIEREFYLSGRSLSGVAAGNGTLDSPSQLMAHAAYIAPIFIANEGGTSTTLLDYMSLEIADDIKLVNGQAKIVESLTTQVNQNKDGITTLTNKTDILENSLNIVEGKVESKAETSAVQIIDNRVTQTEQDISSNTNMINSITNNLSVLSKSSQNILIKSNKVQPYVEGGYPHAYYELGEPWIIGEKYTLIYCAEHRRESRDQTTVLVPYAGGGWEGIVSAAFPVNGDKQIIKGTFIVGQHASEQAVNFYLLNHASGVSDNTVATVYWAVLVRGEFGSATNWFPSAYDYMRDWTAQSDVNQTLSSEINLVDGRVTNVNNSVTTLAGRVGTVEGDLLKKADSSALVGLQTKQDVDNAIALSNTKLTASLYSGNMNLLKESALDDYNHGAWIGNNGFTALIKKEEWPNIAWPPNGRKAMWQINGSAGAGMYQRVSGKFKAGEPLTCSIWAYGDNGTEVLSLMTEGVRLIEPDSSYIKVTNEWKRYTVKGYAVDDVINLVMYLGPNMPSGTQILISEVKLERGLIGSDWSESAEETQARLDATAASIAENRAGVERVEGKITSTASDLTNLTGRVNTAEGNITGLFDATRLLAGRVEQTENNITINSQSINNVKATLATRVDYIISTFRNGSSAGPGPFGLIDSQGSRVGVMGRGLTIWVYGPDGKLYDTAIFDTYGQGVDAMLACANYINNNIPNEYYFTLVGNDNIGWFIPNNNYVVQLRNTIIANGGTGDYFDKWGNNRLPIFTSRKGAATGTGICHMFTSSVQNDWIKYPLSLIGGVPSGLAGAPSIDESKFATADALNTLNAEVKQNGRDIVTNANAITNVNASISNINNIVSIRDTRYDNFAPEYYRSTYPFRTVNEFKLTSTIGVNNLISSMYCNLQTITPWGDKSGGAVQQVATNGDGTEVAYRFSEGNPGSETWSVWTCPTKDILNSLGQKAEAKAVQDLSVYVGQVDNKASLNAQAVTQLQIDVGNNSASLVTQGRVVDGLAASYVVKTDVNGLVTSYGVYNQDGVGAFGVNADYFYVGKGTTATNGKKPFMVLTSPQTIGGTTYPAGTWIDVAMIANATIGTAHIADASITNAKITTLDAGKITSGYIDAARIRAGSISADKMTLGLTDNLWPNRYFDPNGPVLSNGKAVMIANITELGGYGMQLSGRDHIGNTNALIPVRPGDTIVIEYTAAFGDGPNRPLGVGLWVYDDWGQTGSAPWQYGIAEQLYQVQGGWYRYRRTFTVTNNGSGRLAKSGALYFQIEQSENEANPTYWNIGDVVVKRRFGGELLVDGSITATKLKVDSLSAISANLGTLVTYKDPSQPNKARMVMQGSLITVYDDNNVLRVRMGLW